MRHDFEWNSRLRILLELGQRVEIACERRRNPETREVFNKRKNTLELTQPCTILFYLQTWRNVNPTNNGIRKHMRSYIYIPDTD